MNNQLSLFDYTALDTETRVVVQQRTSEIKTLMRRTAQDIIDIGEKLIEVRSRLANGAHGTYENWLKSEFAWAYSTALRFIQVAERFTATKLVSVDISASALYLLASPSTPEEARIEAMNRAESGESITYSAAKTIVAESKAVASMPALEVAESEPPSTWRPTLAFLPPVQPRPYEPPPYAEARKVDTPIHPEPEAVAVPTPPAVKVYHSSESNEWYTPAEIIERARTLLNGIDLDPASSDVANETVKALHYFTAETDGLSQPWAGNVWLNPPYGTEIGAWTAKLGAEYNAGRVTEALLLVPARTDTVWFRGLRDYVRCFLWGRLRFTSGATGETGDAAGFPSMIVYMGRDWDRFIKAFSDIGDAYMYTETMEDEA